MLRIAPTFALTSDEYVAIDRTRSRIVRKKENMSELKIQSANVILVEGGAGEFVPDTKPATGMHGFAIMVPTGEGGEWLLDLLWRITMAYAGLPSLLMNQATVRKIVDAVMSANSEELKRARDPAIQSRSPERLGE